MKRGDGNRRRPELTAGVGPIGRCGRQTSLLCWRGQAAGQVDFHASGARPQALQWDLGARYRARVLAVFGRQVERIVLFGSRVRGNLHEDSDWDFAVYLDHQPDKGEEEERLREISHTLSEDTGEQVQTSCSRRSSGARPTSSPATFATTG